MNGYFEALRDAAAGRDDLAEALAWAERCARAESRQVFVETDDQSNGYPIWRVGNVDRPAVYVGSAATRVLHMLACAPLQWIDVTTLLDAASPNAAVKKLARAADGLRRAAPALAAELRVGNGKVTMRGPLARYYPDAGSPQIVQK